VTPDPLIAAATAVRLRAFAPFSHFLVGAALEADDGTVVTGCNVESASYGLTLCAERVAVFKGVSEGRRRFRRIAVVADTDTPTPPCGACRQILWEFAPDAEVLLANLAGKVVRYTMRELLPAAFDAGQLGDRSA
jgi:cytidine deaminase